jgi:predicted nucleic acid-binding protein
MPTRIIVSDSSCLIDLRKGSLLEVFLRLPYEFLIPNTLFEDELLKFTEAQKQILLDGGLKVIDLPGERVMRAQQVVRTVPQLSAHDGLAFALAESHPGCILLSGDGELRRFASEHEIEVHGILWILDELHRCKLATASRLESVLTQFSGDANVRLPPKEIAACLRRYRKKD